MDNETQHHLFSSPFCSPILPLLSVCVRVCVFSCNSLSPADRGTFHFFHIFGQSQRPKDEGGRLIDWPHVYYSVNTRGADALISGKAAVVQAST